VLSFMDLSQVLPANGIEGVTVDELGTIYLVAEQDQTGSALPDARSQLIVLAPVAAVPEPATLATMALGLALIGVRVRRKG
jgi:PEP-CTERM motif